MSKEYDGLDEWEFNKGIVKPNKTIEHIGYLQDHGWNLKDIGQTIELTSVSEIWKELQQKKTGQD